MLRTPPAAGLLDVCVIGVRTVERLTVRVAERSGVRWVSCRTTGLGLGAGFGVALKPIRPKRH